MNVKDRIEVHCHQADAPTFARLGFTTATAEPGESSAGLKMSHPGVDDTVVATLLALGFQGKAFTAHVIGFDRFTSMLIATDGKDLVVVPTFRNWTEPAVCIGRYGQRASDKTRRYWVIKGNFEEALHQEVNA